MNCNYIVVTPQLNIHTNSRTRMGTTTPTIYMCVVTYYVLVSYIRDVAQNNSNFKLLEAHVSA